MSERAELLALLRVQDAEAADVVAEVVATVAAVEAETLADVEEFGADALPIVDRWLGILGRQRQALEANYRDRRRTTKAAIRSVGGAEHPAAAELVALKRGSQQRHESTMATYQRVTARLIAARSKLDPTRPALRVVDVG